MHPSELSSYDSAFRALAQLIDVGVLILTPNRTVDFVNQRARILLECHDDDTAPACWQRVRDAIDPVLDRAGTPPDDLIQETVFLGEAPAGQQIKLDVYCLHNQNQQLTGYLALVKDHDALQRVEHSLRLAMQMRHTGQLYEAVAHDLRQPIGAILIHLKVLEEMGSMAQPDGSLRASYREAVHTIRSEVKELDNSLQLLLRELSPKDTEELFSLRDVLYSVVSLIKPRVEHADLRLDTDISASDLVIRGRRFRIKQAILNLATNAVEAMTAGTLTLQLDTADGYARVAVHDEGPGIAPDVQVRMYDRHFTTKTEGTGLGLHIVKQTAASHGGYVTAESTSGEGTTFYLYLPLAPSPEEADQADDATAEDVSLQDATPPTPAA